MKNNYLKNPFLIFITILIIIIIIVIIYYNNILSNRNNLLEKFITVSSNTTPAPPPLQSKIIKSSNDTPILKHIFLNSLVTDKFIADNQNAVFAPLILIKKKDSTIYILSKAFILIFLNVIYDCREKSIKTITDLKWDTGDTIYFPTGLEFICNKIKDRNIIISDNKLNPNNTSLKNIKIGDIIIASILKNNNYNEMQTYIFKIKSFKMHTDNIIINLTSIIPPELIQHANNTKIPNNANNAINMPFVIINISL